MNKTQATSLQLTEKGRKDYTTLLKTLIRIYNGEEPKFKYNTDQMVLGFGMINLSGPEQTREWVICLRWLIGGNLSEEVTETIMSDGTKKVKIKLIYAEVS